MCLKREYGLLSLKRFATDTKSFRHIDIIKSSEIHRVIPIEDLMRQIVYLSIFQKRVEYRLSKVFMGIRPEVSAIGLMSTSGLFTG